MALTIPEIVSGGALLLAILSAIWQRFGVILEIKKDQASMSSSLQKEIADSKSKCSDDIAVLKDNLLGQISSQVNSLYTQLDNFSARLAMIDNRMTKQEMKMDLFWGAVQDTVKDMLKQPIHLRKDDLLDRFPSLSYDELCELKSMLVQEKISLPMVKTLTPDKKVYLISLALMLAGIDSRLIDMETKC